MRCHVAHKITGIVILFGGGPPSNLRTTWRVLVPSTGPRSGGRRSFVSKRTTRNAEQPDGVFPKCQGPARAARNRDKTRGSLLLLQPFLANRSCRDKKWRSQMQFPSDGGALLGWWVLRPPRVQFPGENSAGSHPLPLRNQ